MCLCSLCHTLVLICSCLKGKQKDTASPFYIGMKSVAQPFACQIDMKEIPCGTQGCTHKIRHRISEYIFILYIVLLLG